MKKNQDNVAISNVSTDLIKKRRKRRIGYVALGVLGIGIGVGAIVKLTDSGSALNHTQKVIQCAETEALHHHDETCYGTDEYGNEVLTCGYADYFVHKHNDYCYDDDGNLICPLPEVEEHIHDESCYVEERILICPLEETELPLEPETITVTDGEGTVTDGHGYFENEEPVSDGTVVDDGAASDNNTVSDNESDGAATNNVTATDGEVADNAAAQDDASANNDGAVSDNAAEEAPTDSVTIEDTVAPLAATPHVHDDSCYEIRRVLSCGKLELHTHDESCYDESGKLICGKLELREHKHTEDCVTKRELTEEEIEALNKANRDEMTQPEIHTKTYECDEYIVAVTYSDLAEIPEEAELVVKEIAEDDAKYEKIRKEVVGSAEGESKGEAAKEEEAAEGSESEAASAGEDIFKALDISFMVGGVEIEPKDEVQVDIKFLENDFEDNDEVTVHHLTNNGVDNLGTQAIDGSGDLSFATDSFSTFVVTTKQKSESEPAPGTYNKKELRYNDMEDAFLTDKYAEYRRENGAIGQYASNFHIVAFDTVSGGSHINGNILARRSTVSSNFGTNNYDKEVTYIQEFPAPWGWPTYPTGMCTGGSNKIVAVGSTVPIKLEGSELWIGNTKAADCNGANLFIKDIASDEAPFINFDNVRTEVDGIMNSLAAQNTDVNVDVRLDKNYIRITNPEACGYANLKASELQWKNDLKLIGFQTGKKGSLVINVDCSGCDSWELPTRAYIWFDADVDGSGNVSGGRQGATGEVNEFSDGKVIWNLLNCKEGMQVKICQMTGIVLAPDADFSIDKMNGNIVGRNVNITGETHRTDFTGTTLPFSARFHGTKTVDGSIPSAGQVFDFELSEYNGRTWEVRQTVKNQGGDINFKDIEYDCSKRPSEAGDHWYMIREKSGGSSGITFDNSAYIFRVKVSYNSATGQTTAVFDSYKKADYQDGISPSSGTSIGGAEDIIFDNSTSTSIEVEKEWYDVNGEDRLYENLPDRIVVGLYQAVGEGEGSRITSRQDATVTLSAANNWYYKWSDLPRQDESGNTYSYYVREDSVPGYELVGETLRKTEGKFTLRNKKKPAMTTVKVEKKFFVGDDQVYNSSNGDKDTYAKFKLLWSGDGGQTWQTHVYKNSVYNYDNHSGVYTLNEANHWYIEIGDLPAEGFQTGSYKKYQYKVVEEVCNIPGFKFGMPGGDCRTTSEVETVDENSFVIKNTTNDTKDIEIDKHWLTVENGEDGIQKGANSTAFITLKLFVGSNVIGTYKMTYDNFVQVDDAGNVITPAYEIEVVDKWAARIKGLPKYVAENGKLALARYELSEVAVNDGEGHDVVFDGYEMIENITSDPDDDLRVFSLKNKCFVTYDLPATGGRGTLTGIVNEWLKGHLN